MMSAKVFTHLLQVSILMAIFCNSIYGQWPSEQEVNAYRGNPMYWIDQMMDKDILDGSISGTGNFPGEAFFMDCKLGHKKYFNANFLPNDREHWLGIIHDSENNADRIYRIYKVSDYRIMICETVCTMTVQIENYAIIQNIPELSARIVIKSLFKGLNDDNQLRFTQNNEGYFVPDKNNYPQWMGTISWKYSTDRLRIYFLKIPEDYAPASDLSFYIKKNQNWFTPTNGFKAGQFSWEKDQSP